MSWGPAIAYMAAIFAVSGDPDPPQPPGWAAFDKWEHMAAYFLLGLLLFRAFGGYWQFSAPAAGASAVLAGAAHGILAEIHQVFVPQRTSEVNDAIADVVGVLGAQVAIALVLGLRPMWRARSGEAGPGD